MASRFRSVDSLKSWKAWTSPSSRCSAITITNPAMPTSSVRLCGSAAFTCSMVTTWSSTGSASPGVKGFGGGFGRRTLGAFGEQVFKDFVQAALDEALKLETALRTLDAPVRIALLHYAPIPETLKGEPEQIFPFLGTSRLLPAIETYAPDVVFHGHAHIGAAWGKTPSGIPVFNVASMLLQKHIGRPYRVWTADAPERRRDRD
jgi:hypothetical protein